MTALPRPFSLAAAALLLGPLPGVAQTYTWDGGAGNGSWNAAANWNPNGVPVAGTGTVIVLDGTVQTATVQNLGSPFLLSQLVLGANATNGFTVSGNGLRFAPGGKIVFNGPAGVESGLRVDAPVDFGAGAVAVETNANAGAGAYFEVVLGGPVTGSGTVTKGGSQPGELVLAGANGTFTGSLAISNGQVQLAAANALGRGAAVSVGSGAVLLAGYGQSVDQGFAAATGVSQAVGSVEGAGLLQVGHPSSAATALVGFTGGTRVFGGLVSAGNAGSQLAKVGAGTWELTGSSTTFLAGLSARDGVVLLDAAGTLSPTATTAAVGGTTVYAGASVRLDNAATNNPNRLQDNGVVTLAGGTLRLDGNGAGNTSEVVGGLAVGPGQSTVVVNPVSSAAGGGAQFSVAPTRSGVVTIAQPAATGTVFFRGENLGAFSASAPPANTAVAGVVYADPTAVTALLVGGGGTGAATSVLPFALGTSTNGTDPDTLATYGANGVRPLVPTGTGAEYAPFATAGNTNNVRDGTFTVSTAATRNALVATGGAVTLNATLTLTSGVLLTTGVKSTVDRTGSAALLFAASGSPVTAYVTTVADLTLSAPVTAANLAKSGAGQLNLGAAVTLTAAGTAAVNAGTLKITPGGSVGVASGALTYQVSRGATLDVSTATGGLTLGTNRTLTGNGTVAGPVTVGSGGTVAPDSLSGPGTLSVAGMTWQGGGAYRWTAASVVTDAGGVSPYTAGSIAGGGALDLTSSTLTSTTPFTVRAVSLAPSNAAGAVYDFDPTAAYSWTIATFAGGITGFDKTHFAVDASGFTGATQAFALSQSGNNLVLTYGTPVPEPAGLLIAGAAGLLAAAGRGRRGGVRICVDGGRRGA